MWIYWSTLIAKKNEFYNWLAIVHATLTLGRNFYSIDQFKEGFIKRSPCTDSRMHTVGTSGFHHHCQVCVGTQQTVSTVDCATSYRHISFTYRGFQQHSVQKQDFCNTYWIQKIPIFSFRLNCDGILKVCSSKLEDHGSWIKNREQIRPKN